MSKKKPVILGPDGKPYAPPPKKAEPRKIDAATAAAKAKDHGVAVGSYTFLEAFLTPMPIFAPPWGVTTARPNAAAGLRDAVARDLAALTAGFDGRGGEELPKPPADLTAYADAFASARAKCPHENVIDMSHARREVYCEDCRQYVKRPRGLFG